MVRIHAVGIALLAAVCMVTAPALGAGKKSTSESKRAESTKRRAEKKAKSSATRKTATESKSAADKTTAPKAKSASTTKRNSDSKSKTRVAPTSKDADRRNAEAARKRASETIRQAPAVQRDLDQQGNLGNASSGNPTDPATKAAEQRAGRKAPGASSESAQSTSRLDDARSTAPQEPERALDKSEPGTVANPVADPLAKAGGIASPAPTAEQLQEQSRAAKGDRASQASTVIRVNEQKPFEGQGGGIVDKNAEFKITPIKDETGDEAEKNAEADDPDAEAEAEKRHDEEEAEEERRAEEKAEEERAEAEAAKERAEQETTTRPNEANATEYITKMTDEEIAARKAETKAGLVNPTGVVGQGEVVDPNRAREIGRTASPRAGWAIDPGTGEAGGPAPTPDEAPERPDECDLAGGAAGDCGAGDGLR